VGFIIHPFELPEDAAATIEHLYVAMCSTDDVNVTFGKTGVAHASSFLAQ
jgi:hypothetical protein